MKYFISDKHQIFKMKIQHSEQFVTLIVNSRVISSIFDSLILCEVLVMEESPNLKSNILASVRTDSSSAPAVS